MRFRDKIDFKRTNAICYSTRESGNRCVELTSIIKKLDDKWDVNVGDRAELRWNVSNEQFLCVSHLSYVDERGISVNLDAAELHWQFNPSNYSKPFFAISEPKASPEQYGSFLEACSKPAEEGSTVVAHCETQTEQAKPNSPN